MSTGPAMAMALTVLMKVRWKEGGCANFQVPWRNNWWLVDECSKEKSGPRILKEATVHLQSVAAHFINGIKLWILPGISWAQHASLSEPAHGCRCV